MAFGVLWTNLLVWVGFAGFSGVLVWVARRLEFQPLSRIGGVEPSMGGALLHTVGLLFVVLGVPLFVSYGFIWRGVEGECGGVFLSNGITRFSILCQVGVPGLFFWVLPLAWLRVNPVQWGLERVAVLLVLQLCWTWALQSSSLLTLLLWLEVIGLVGILALGFYGFTTDLSPAWRGRHGGQATNRSVVVALLVLLWTNGLSTVVLLLAYGLSLFQITGLDWGLTTLLVSHGGGLGLGAKALVSGTSYFLGIGLMIKLLIQPLQFFVLSLYRLLPIGAFMVYVLAYYSIFLVLILNLLVGPLGLLLSSWLLGVVATLLLTLVGFGGGLEQLLDIRVALAFSTLLNLTLLVLATGVAMALV